MAHTITGRLNKAASQFQAGEYTGFGVQLGVKYRDPKSKEEAWTNYKAAIFTKSPQQIQFYQTALVEGSVVSVNCEKLKIDSYQGQNGLNHTLEMIQASLEYVNFAQQPQQNQGSQAAQHQAQQQPQYQQNTQQAPQPQQQQNNDGFDDIPWG